MKECKLSKSWSISIWWKFQTGDVQSTSFSPSQWQGPLKPIHHRLSLVLNEKIHCSIRSNRMNYLHNINNQIMRYLDYVRAMQPQYVDTFQWGLLELWRGLNTQQLLSNSDYSILMKQNLSLIWHFQRGIVF